MLFYYFRGFFFVLGCWFVLVFFYFNPLCVDWTEVARAYPLKLVVVGAFLVY